MTTCIITKKTKFDPKTKTALFFSEMQKFKYWPNEDSNEDFLLLSKDPPEKVSKKRQKQFGDEFESLVEKKLLDLGFKKMDLEKEAGELFRKPPQYSIDKHVLLQTKLLYAIYDSLTKDEKNEAEKLFIENKPKATKRKTTKK